jgi:hypothetical protein
MVMFSSHDLLGNRVSGVRGLGFRGLGLGVEYVYTYMYLFNAYNLLRGIRMMRHK